MAAIAMAVAATACGGASDDDPRDNASGAATQDSPPRAESGYAEIRSEPIEIDEPVTPEAHTVYAPYVHFHIESLGTVQAIRTGEGVRRPAKGETFYVANIEATPDQYEARTSANPDPDSGELPEFPYASLRSSEAEEQLDLDQLHQSILENEPKPHTYTLIAAGGRKKPPTLAVGSYNRTWLHQIDLKHGRKVGKSPGIRPDIIKLSDSYEDTVTADLPLDLGADVINTTNFATARISSFSANGVYDPKFNVVSVDAQVRFDSDGSDTVDIGYMDEDSAKLVDDNGNEYPSSQEASVHPRDQVELGQAKNYRFEFEVPRGESEFTFVYRPEMSLIDGETPFAQKELPLDFAAE